MSKLDLSCHPFSQKKKKKIIMSSTFNQILSSTINIATKSNDLIL